MVWTNTTGAELAASTDVTAVSRLGAKNGGTNKRELFLKQFSGEVLTTFEERNIAMPLHRVRTISNGKSAQFPVIGKIDADYHTAGQTILGDSVEHSEITVTVDDLLVSSAFVPRIDEAMNHYEVRSTYSSEMGNALANAADRNIFSTIYTGATTNQSGDLVDVWAAGSDTPFAAGEAGKIRMGSADNDYNGDDIVTGIITALEAFDSQDVTGEKYCVLNPEAYYRLMGANTVAMNRDAGGNGSVALGQAPTVGGVKILMSNHLPSVSQVTPSPLATSTNSGAARSSAYDDYDANLKGLIFTKDAAATVKLLDLGVESEYQIERQGTLMVAKYAMGHNSLRNKAAIALCSKPAESVDDSDDS